MFPKLVPLLVVLSALWGSYAASSSAGDDVSSAVYRAGLVTNELVTGIVLGTDSTGHTTYSLALAESLTINPTATAPDTALSAAATLVEGSTDAHFHEVVTFGADVVAVSEDCSLGTGFAACTLIEKNTAGSVIQSTAFTTTLAASTSGGSVTVATSTASANGTQAASATTESKNGAGQLDVVGASLLAVVAAGAVLVGAMV
ncbi:hypothetical protein V8D89_007591 [Ganoderma adspersum]